VNGQILIHATAVKLCDAAKPFGGTGDGAVLLTGESGAGKSDVALRLIAMGAKLVADDQTALFEHGGRCYAETPSNLRGRIEIRNVGIVSLDYAGATPVVLAVKLAKDGAIARLPEPALFRFPPALGACPRPPLLVLNPFEASAPAKIAAAAAAIERGAFVAGVVSHGSGSFF
jgi:hypothetical protein